MHIIVLACNARSPLVTPHLKNQPHKVFINGEHTYTGPKPFSFLNNAYDPGAFSCYQGHMSIWRTITQPTLILEDDAVPIYNSTPSWYEIATNSIPLLDDYDIVSLHSRFNPDDIDRNPKTMCRKLGFTHLKPRNTGRFTGIIALGSLAYLISPQTVKKYIPMLEWDGMPIDLHISNRFSFCTLLNTCFLHNRSQGSIIENIKAPLEHNNRLRGRKRVRR
jgi:GR25 family glycosyltransferase involved in LPS biosynthesis